jgi:hypothetical protein
MLGLASGCSSAQSSSGQASSGGSATTPVKPAGWKTVEGGGYAIYVPSSWTVGPWQPTCGVTVPTVYLGPQGQLPKCTTKALGAEADIGAYAYSGTQKPVTKTINGLTAYEVTTTVQVAGPPAGTVTEAWVRVYGPSHPHGFYFYVGDSPDMPGGGPGMAEKIIDTIHAITP